MEKDKMLYDFDQYLDEVYGKPGTPTRDAFRNNVTAYRNMIEQVDKELGIEKIETEEQRDWAEKRVNELVDLMDEDTPIYDHNSVEAELLAVMVMDYDEEHGYCFPMDEEVEKAIQLKEEYLKEKDNLIESPIFTEQKQIRAGWSEAFAKYAEEGEDEMFLPDFIDNDGEIEL